MATLNVADLNRQGRVFCAANVSAASVIAVTTTMTGLTLYNPLGSGKKAVLIDAGFVWTTVPAAVHNVGLAVLNTNAGAIPTGITNLAIAADGSGNLGVVQASASIVLNTAPVARRWFLNALYQAASAAGTTVAAATQFDRIDGSLILVPGASVSLCAVTTTAVGMGSFTWAELPI